MRLHNILCVLPVFFLCQTKHHPDQKGNLEERKEGYEMSNEIFQFVRSSFRTMTGPCIRHEVSVYDTVVIISLFRLLLVGRHTRGWIYWQYVLPGHYCSKFENAKSTEFGFSVNRSNRFVRISYISWMFCSTFFPPYTYCPPAVSISTVPPFVVLSIMFNVGFVFFQSRMFEPRFQLFSVQFFHNLSG